MVSRRRTSVRWNVRLLEGLRELGRMPVRFALHLAVARLITQWRSLLTIIAGTILAASIGSLVPLYTTAIAQVGMTQRLAEEPAQDVHIQSNISLRASTERVGDAALPELADAATQTVRTLADRDLGVISDWVDAVVVYEESEAMGMSQVVSGAESGAEGGAEGAAGGEDELAALAGIRARVAHYGGWQDHVRVVAGRLPQHPPVTDPDAAASAGPVNIEVVIGLTVANELNLDVGTLLELDQSMNERGTLGRGHPSSVPVTAQIVGIVAPLDEEDAFWMAPSPLRLLDRAGGAGLWDYEFAFLTTRDAVYRVATEFIPDTPTRIGWRVLFAHDNLPFSRIDTAREALLTFERNMEGVFRLEAPVGESGGQQNRQNLAFNYHTRLIDYDVLRKDVDNGILLDYANEQALLDAPFGLLLLQVGALVLFFLIVTAALVRRGERREIAMLQSRGAWDSQIVLLRGIEALLICILATAVAPLLSRQLLTAVGPSVANTDDFPLPLTADAFVFAGFAAAVTFLALMGTLRPVLRLPLVLAGGAATRGENQPWWQRYYLDAALAVVGLGALALLVRNGSPLSDVNLGGEQADPLMLMAPALLFLALGSLALRFFPVLARITSRVSAAGRGLLSALASWQVSREPVHYGRITFLLALAIGIGWFATSFRATLTNSHEDQAKYTVGTDVRIVERDARLNVNRARPASYYAGLDDVAAASTAYRFIGANLSTSVQGDIKGDILAIDPATFGQTLYWRSDLGPIYTPRTVDSFAVPERGRALPFIPARLGLWARFDFATFFGGDDSNYFADVGRLIQRTEINLRFLDADGAWLIVPVEPVEIEYRRAGVDEPGANARGFVNTGWVYLEADLSALEYEPVGPLNLVSIFWTYRSFSQNGENGLRLTLADLTLIDAAGDDTPYPVFSTEAWEFVYDRGALAEGNAFPVANVAGERQDAIYLRWDQDASRTTVGALLNYPEPGPIDAIISARMQSDNGLPYGLDATPFRLINIGGMNPQFRAVQVSDYYPSLYNRPPSEGNPKGDTFMVVDVRELLYTLNRRPSATLYADEVWLRLGDDVNVRRETDVAAMISTLDEAEGGRVVILSETTLADELGKLRTNPLGLGLLGLMYLAFVTALVLSVVGLLTYAGLTAQARRTEFGVLRALGLSSLRVVGGLALEQGFVMLIGIALGATLGFVLANQVVPTLALGATGDSVVPPFVMRVEAQRLLEYGLLMLVVMLLVLSSSLLLVRQLSLARTLRLGDE